MEHILRLGEKHASKQNIATNICLFSSNLTSICSWLREWARFLFSFLHSWTNYTIFLTSLLCFQANGGVRDEVLESYCWMYAHFKIPSEYKGACSGQEQDDIEGNKFANGKAISKRNLIMFLLVVVFQASFTTLTTNGYPSF